TSVIILLTCIFMPPLGAFLLKGCGAEVIIAICLTILGWIPGILYVFWLWL
ncbi:plasma membrane proteolipid 3, partial [Protomyces lactucae-debilis]